MYDGIEHRQAIGSIHTHLIIYNGQILDQCYGPYKVHFIAQENRAGGQNETCGDFIHTYPSFKKYH